MKNSSAAISQAGHYLGTEIDEKWWKRYRKNKFLARGNGVYRFEQASFCFLRYMTKKPIEIQFKDIVDIKTGKWHAGKWCIGLPIVKILWMKEGLRLSSGFVVSKSRDAALRFVEDLKRRAGLMKANGHAGVPRDRTGDL